MSPFLILSFYFCGHCVTFLEEISTSTIYFRFRSHHAHTFLLQLVPLDRNTVSFLFTDTSPKWLRVVWSCRYSAFFVYPLSRPVALQGGGGMGCPCAPTPSGEGHPNVPSLTTLKTKANGPSKIVADTPDYEPASLGCL